MARVRVSRKRRAGITAREAIGAVLLPHPPSAAVMGVEAAGAAVA
jgi:hypothetical protein